MDREYYNNIPRGGESGSSTYTLRQWSTDYGMRNMSTPLIDLLLLINKHTQLKFKVSCITSAWSKLLPLLGEFPAKHLISSIIERLLPVVAIADRGSAEESYLLLWLPAERLLT